MIQAKECPLCGGQILQVLKKYRFAPNGNPNLTAYGRDRLNIFFEKVQKAEAPTVFDATMCAGCGFIFTNPRFTREEVRLKYEAISDVEASQSLGERVCRTQARERALRIRSLTLQSRCRPNDPGAERASRPLAVLDYGGAEGYNLMPFLDNGDSCFLLDYVEYPRAQGVHYVGRDLADLPSAAHFDVILLCHTLEHVVEPLGLIQDLAARLTDDGRLYVEVPLGCWREWANLEEPLTHVNFFSEESLWKCFRRANLQVVHLSTRYEWVTQDKRWCVNIVGSRARQATYLGFKTTRQQTHSLGYYWDIFFDDPGRYLAHSFREPGYFWARLRRQK